MAHTIIRHRVEDFDTWKRFFDSTEELRRARGETGWRIFQDENDPNDITVVTTHQDVDAASSWIGSDAFHEKIVEGGIVGEPEIRFLSELGTGG